MILFQHPHVVSHAFKPDYDAITWKNGDHPSPLVPHKEARTRTLQRYAMLRKIATYTE